MDGIALGKWKLKEGEGKVEDWREWTFITRKLKFQDDRATQESVTQLCGPLFFVIV